MMKNGVGIKNGNTQRMLKLLDEIGPMTRNEIDECLGTHKNQTARLISECMKDTPTFGRRVYIKSWVMDHHGERMYPRAVYALGDGKDAPRPIKDTKAVQKRSRDKIKRLHQTNSVFNLAKSSFRLVNNFDIREQA